MKRSLWILLTLLLYLINLGQENVLHSYTEFSIFFSICNTQSLLNFWINIFEMIVSECNHSSRLCERRADVCEIKSF